jgi:hypothetical protein
MKQKKDDTLRRRHRQAMLLNSKELKAINSYCKRYRITNKSKFMRETIITAVLKKFDEDYPTLFDDQPNLFNSR